MNMDGKCIALSPTRACYYNGPNIVVLNRSVDLTLRNASFLRVSPVAVPTSIDLINAGIGATQEGYVPPRGHLDVRESLAAWRVQYISHRLVQKLATFAICSNNLACIASEQALSP